jgi:type III pantothenate kinase
MMLLVDAGNTRIKWRIVVGRSLQANGVVPTAAVAELAQAWCSYPLTGAVLSCVADASTHDSLAQLMAALRIEVVHWVVPGCEKYGLINLYDVPEKLGSDRYAALIAAARLQLGNCVVVSIGTATTVDMLGRNNEFLGGVIVAGPDLMRSALLGGTGQIKSRMQAAAMGAKDLSPDFMLDPEVVPRNTDAAVEMGIALAQVGVIKGVCERMPGATEQPPLVILTGGARRQISSGLRLQLIEIEDLVLEGLAWIALDLACAD